MEDKIAEVVEVAQLDEFDKKAEEWLAKQERTFVPAPEPRHKKVK